MPFDAIVLNPVWDAVDGNLGIEVVFSVPGTSCVGYDELQKGALEGSALRTYQQIQISVCACIECDCFFQHDLVVCEPLAMRVGSSCLISELLASDSFVLKLNVFQLVHKLACIRTPLQLEMRERALVQR